MCFKNIGKFLMVSIAIEALQNKIQKKNLKIAEKITKKITKNV